MSDINSKIQTNHPKNDVKKWMNDPNNVYMNSSGVVFIDNMRYSTKSTEFANPFIIGTDGTHGEVIMKYKIYMIAKLQNNETLLQSALLSLKEKNEGCCWSWSCCNICNCNSLLEFLNICCLSCC